MFEKIKKMFGTATEIEVEKTPKPKQPRKPKTKKAEPVLSPKEQATQAGEPYINILKIDIDPNDINNGSFELDWNEKFVVNLIRAGYKAKPDDTDADIVDRWFTQVCKNVVLEIYEQEQADPDNRGNLRVIQSKDIGNGRTEIS